MLKNRLFNMLILIALVIVIALTVQEAAATASLVSEAYSARETKTLMCASLPSRHSIRSKYLEEVKRWVLRTEDGPTGIDGGLIELLSNYQTCSR
jgi:hypothetical protein